MIRVGKLRVSIRVKACLHEASMIDLERQHQHLHHQGSHFFGLRKSPLMVFPDDLIFPDRIGTLHSDIASDIAT